MLDVGSRSLLKSGVLKSSHQALNIGCLLRQSGHPLLMRRVGALNEKLLLRTRESEAVAVNRV